MANVIDAFIQAIAAEVVKSAVKQIEYATTCGEQFDKMEKGLGTMNALLSDTKRVRSQKKHISGYLNDLREIIYEADNAVIDFLIRDDERQYWKRHYIRYIFRLWFQDRGFPIRMGKQLENINKEMDKIERNLLHYLSAAAITPGGPIHGDSSNVPIRKNSEDSPPNTTYGLEEDIKKLKGWIAGCNQGKLEPIGIVGMGGLGKTTIAQKLFHDEDVKRTFQKFIWVCVSQNFNEERIMKLMLSNVGITVSDSEGKSMRGTLKSVLQDQNYLIVMDDVWRTTRPGWWDDLWSDLPKQVGKHSCIIITTRFEDVAESMGTRIHKPEPLNKKDRWSLFSESAFRKYKKSKCPNDEFEEVGEEILDKCGGLPLAIKTVGRLLASKQNVSEWRDTKDSFHDLMRNPENRQTEEVMFSLQLSYDDLPSHLKQCLLCAAIYPEDFVIDAEQLIYWWIGEGLVHAKDSNSKTAVEMGYEYLTELVSRCLVEDCNSRGYDGKVYKCKIHDMVRELITTIAQEDRYCFFDEQGRQMQKMQNDISRWLCFTTDKGMMAPKKDNAEAVESSIIKNEKLRALFLMSSPPNDFGKSFEFLPSLRVLDLSYSKLDRVLSNVNNSTTAASLSEELFRWISFLKRLACLNLSGVRKLEEVPSLIQKLLNLRVLVLNGCTGLKRIHPSITRLKKLIVLDFGACPLDNLPRGLGSLSQLQELSGFRVSRSCTISELGKLHLLRVLRITLTNSATNSSVEGLGSLEKLNVLSIDAGECKGESITELKMPEKLKELYLRNFHYADTPKWLHPNHLENLRYLCVESCDTKSLRTDMIWQIQGLCLKESHKLKVDWKELIKNMTKLSYAEIRNCSQVTNLPNEIIKTGVWRRPWIEE